MNTKKYFEQGDYAIVFNSKEWDKTGDLPEGNGIYFQRAKVVGTEKNSYGEWLADVIFDESGLESNGHFQHMMTPCK